MEKKEKNIFEELEGEIKKHTKKGKQLKWSKVLLDAGLPPEKMARVNEIKVAREYLESAEMAFLDYAGDSRNLDEYFSKAKEYIKKLPKESTILKDFKRHLELEGVEHCKTDKNGLPIKNAQGNVMLKPQAVMERRAIVAQGGEQFQQILNYYLNTKKLINKLEESLFAMQTFPFSAKTLIDFYEL